MDTRLLWLALGGFVGANESFLIGSQLPVIAADMGVSVGQAGLLVVGYALVYGIGTPVLATVFGRVDRRPLLAAALLTLAISSLVMALTPQFLWLVVGRLALALGAGLYTATAIATAVAITPPERRGTAVGIVVAGQSFAVLVGVPLGALLASTFGWRSIYFVVAALGLVSATALWLRVPSGIAGDGRSIRERLSALRLPAVPATLLTTTLFMSGAYIPLIFVGSLASYSAGLAPHMLPVILLANGVGAFAGSNFGGRLADRIGPRQAVTAAVVAMAMALLVFALLPWLPTSVSAGLFLLLMGISGFIGWGFWPAQSTSVAGLAPPASVPLVVSLNLSALNVGVALTAAIGGTTLDYLGVEWLPGTAVALVLLALVMVLAVGRGKAA